jgi:hypothetical protein
MGLQTQKDQSELDDWFDSLPPSDQTETEESFLHTHGRDLLGEVQRIALGPEDKFQHVHNQEKAEQLVRMWLNFLNERKDG